MLGIAPRPVWVIGSLWSVLASGDGARPVLAMHALFHLVLRVIQPDFIDDFVTRASAAP
jgi:hypothetical protein